MKGYSRKFSNVMRLARSIVDLQKRINDPKSQSIYFRWGIRNHKARLASMIAEYDRFRQAYRYTSITQLVKEREILVEHYEHIRGVKMREPSFCRSLLQQTVRRRLGRIREQIELKLMVTELPSIEEYRRSRRP